jgi:hypothetical protein
VPSAAAFLGGANSSAVTKAGANYVQSKKVPYYPLHDDRLAVDDAHTHGVTRMVVGKLHHHAFVADTGLATKHLQFAISSLLNDDIAVYAQGSRRRRTHFKPLVATTT